MSGITIDTHSKPKQSGKLALQRIFSRSSQTGSTILAYAPGDPIKADDLGWIEDGGYAIGDSTLDGHALRAAIATAAKKGVQTKEVRGPKEQPKPADDEPPAEDAPVVEVNATARAIEIAATNDIDLAAVKGSGADGRIEANDVKAAVAAKEETK